MTLPNINHIGITVNDLDAAKAFFLELGLEVQGEGEVSGPLVDRVTGLDGVKSTVVFIGAPGAETTIELSKFLTPVDDRGVRPEPVNALGIRHISFAVEHIEALVARLKASGWEPFSEIQNYENTYKLCYVHGPEGIIIEVAERIGS
jgi:catechol 2,3-dioxygenase-like lactoylglutathione lyase family enzyme